jgi:hypothetical protein
VPADKQRRVQQPVGGVVVEVVPVGVVVVVVADGQLVVVAWAAVVAAGIPSGSVWSIWRPSAVIAPTTMRTTSDTRIVYSSTDAPRSAPHSLFTS